MPQGSDNLDELKQEKKEMHQEFEFNKNIIHGCEKSIDHSLNNLVHYTNKAKPLMGDKDSSILDTVVKKLEEFRDLFKQQIDSVDSNCETFYKQSTSNASSTESIDLENEQTSLELKQKKLENTKTVKDLIKTTVFSNKKMGSVSETVKRCIEDEDKKLQKDLDVVDAKIGEQAAVMQEYLDKKGDIHKLIPSTIGEAPQPTRQTGMTSHGSLGTTGETNRTGNSNNSISTLNNRNNTDNRNIQDSSKDTSSDNSTDSSLATKLVTTGGVIVEGAVSTVENISSSGIDPSNTGLF